MFRTAELGQKVSKAEYREREPLLRQELLEVQQQLREAANCPVIILFAGVDGAGKGDTVNRLNEWMDPRWIVTRAYDEPSDEERERPEYWRFWRDLPSKGRIGMYLSSWYSRPLLERVYDKDTDRVFDERLDRILAFEKALADDGALILKFWMHLSQAAQKRRLKKLEKDPLTSWRVTQRDWDHWHIYDRFEATAERAIMRTSTGSAPWSIVEGEDPYYRSLTVGMIVRDEIRKRIDEFGKKKNPHAGAGRVHRTGWREDFGVFRGDRGRVAGGIRGEYAAACRHPAVTAGYVALTGQERLQAAVEGAAGAA